MSKEQTNELLTFLTPFTPEIQQIALELRDFVWDLYPDCNELIYDNYNAVAFGWSPTDRIGDIFCSIAVGSNKYVHFGFYWGSKLTDPENILLGKGNQYRYIKVKSPIDFPELYIKTLLKEAYTNSRLGLADGELPFKGVTIVKSISPTKKRP